MKRFSLLLLLVVGFCMGSAGMVQATDVTVGNARWYTFCAGYDPQFPNNCSQDSFAVGASNAYGDNPGAPPWTYTAATGTAVKITDTAAAGDMYRLYDFGAFIGDTSTVGTLALGTNNQDPNVDYLDPQLSHGLFNLAAGSHSLTIQIIQHAEGNLSAIGYFRVDPVSSVPEPATLLLLGLGLVGLAGVRRKLKK